MAEKARLQRSTEAASAQLRDVWDGGAALQERLDSAEREKAKLAGEVALLGSEVELLRDRSKEAGRQLEVAEEAAREAAREKGALARLNVRVEELEAEVKHVAQRLVDSEGDVCAPPPPPPPPS